MDNQLSVRITVLRRTVNADLLERYATSAWEPCERLADGQVFVSDNANMPQGFCSHAWAAIYPFVFVLARGGAMRGTKDGSFVSCCNDGFRPVFFLLERISDK